jgi:lipoprotein NlpD
VAGTKLPSSSPVAKPVVPSPSTTTQVVAAAAPVFEPVTASSATTPATSSSSSLHGTTLHGTTVAHPVATVPAVRPVVPAASVAASATSTVVPVAGVPTPAPATLPPPVPTPVAAGPSRAISGVNWRWPADGSLLSRFQSGDAIPGIQIAGKPSDPVRAAADGVVVYSGNGLVGYGELVIIKHNDSFLSAYGHNSKRLVKEGQRVSAGQQIAEMGSTGATRNELEFQIRKDGNPVDPLGYLPPH